MAMMSGAVAQNYTRPVPGKVQRSQRKTVSAEIVYDTVSAPAADSIPLAGVEKPLRSVRERLFVTNNTSRPIVGVTIEVTYFDMHGNMMHKVDRDISVTLPAGETRRVEFPSFDRQQLFYYHLSPLPRGAVQATPFEVSVKVLDIIHPQIHH